MKTRIIFVLLFLIPAAVALSKNAQQKFDKLDYYEAMSLGSIDVVNNEIDVVVASSPNGKDGYEGALLMRKAGLVKAPPEKLKLFKAGRIKLETAIINDKENAEFRFLRLAIQEHAPKIVKYNTDLQTDKQIVIKAYKNLSPVVQRAIMDYTKNSKILHEQDL